MPLPDASPSGVMLVTLTRMPCRTLLIHEILPIGSAHRFILDGKCLQYHHDG